MNPRILIGAVSVCCWLGGCALPQSRWKDVASSRPEPGPKPSPTATQNQPAAQLDKNQPVNIESDRMQYQNQDQITVFRGRVVVSQPQARMRTPYLEVRSHEGLAQARGGIELEDYQRGITVTAREMDYSKNLSDVVIREEVRVNTQDERGQALKIASQKLEWHQDRDEALATGQVVVHYQDTTATAQSMRFQSAGDELALSSDDPLQMPELLRGQDRISGRLVKIFTRQRQFDVDGNAQAIIMPQAAKTEKIREQP